MKKILMLFTIAIGAISCQKKELSPTDLTRKILQEQLSPSDFALLDLSTASIFTTESGQKLIRADFTSEHRFHDFVILSLTAESLFKEGRIVHITGASGPSSRHPSNQTFNGRIEVLSLQHDILQSSAIIDGFIMSLHTSTIAVNSVNASDLCGDCSLPEFIVTASYQNGSYDWISWLHLWFLFESMPRNQYIPIDYTGSGGSSGGGSYDPPAVISRDEEAAEIKESIDQKKYTDCFEAIPDGSTTLYTLTISADLPTDGHPEIFYNWTDGSPGHAFITLSKSNPYGGVSQSFGFYPTNSYKLITLDNRTHLASKIVNDGGHEYQAQYTISVNATQFQAAISAVNGARDNYNVAFYNCTDFALDVFNAAGGNLSIPRHAIPGFEAGGGSNTPQGLYEKIQAMKNNGVANTHTTNTKEYAGNSKGPCN